MLDKTLFGIVGALGLAVMSSQAQATHVFGAKLNHDLQVPSICNPNKGSDLCTWVLSLGQSNVGHEAAPVDGTITQIRMMACGKGSFILQIAHAKRTTHQAQVVRTGPLINYVGNTDRNCNGGPGGFFIETFNVSVPVKKGDVLAVVAVIAHVHRQLERVRVHDGDLREEVAGQLFYDDPGGISPEASGA